MFSLFGLFLFNTHLLFSFFLGLGFAEYGLSQRIMFTTEPNLQYLNLLTGSTQLCVAGITALSFFHFFFHFCSPGLLLLYSLLVLLTVWSFPFPPTFFSNSVSSNFVYIPSRIDTVDARRQDTFVKNKNLI